MVDSFSKFTWLYTTKSTSTTEVVDRLRKQATLYLAIREESSLIGALRLRRTISKSIVKVKAFSIYWRRREFPEQMNR